MAKIQITENLVGSINDASGEYFLNVNTNFIPECIDFLRNNRNYGVYISSFSGYESEGLDFLGYCPWLERIVVDGLRDLQQLAILKNLKSLTLHDSSWRDFSCFPELEIFYGFLDAEHKGFLSHKKLKSVLLKKLKPLTKDCNNLFPSCIEQITVIEGNLISLSGLEKLPLLTKVQLAYLPKLIDITSLAKIVDLEVLDLESCKKAIDIDTFSKCEKLNTLKLNKCGEIGSMDFVKSLRKLLFVSFVGTTLGSGDLTCFLDHPTLKYVGFMNSKKYNLTFDSLNARLKSK